MSDRFTHENLTWTSTGDVWASWRLQPLPKPRTRDQFEAVRAVHQQLLANLVGHEILLQGVLGWTDASSILDAMLRGVDPERCPSWVEECEASVDRLTEASYGRREYVLHVRLRSTPGPQLTRAFRAALNSLAESAGLSPLRPSTADIEDRTEAARLVQTRIPAPFAAVPLTPWEKLWLARNAQTRTGELIGPASRDLAATFPVTKASVGRPLLDAGGLTDLSTGAKARLTRARAPLTRRWLKVTADTGEVSYQSGMVLSVPPPGKPGEELDWHTAGFIGDIDHTGVPVDWAIRSTIHGRNAARKRNKAASRKLTDQLDQVGDSPTQSGRQARLMQASEVLSEYATTIELDDTAIETRPIIMVTVAAGSGEAADTQAKSVTDATMFDRFVWARPVGAEEAIHHASQPGGQISAQLRDYAQIGLGSDLAATIPVVGNRLGHDSGIHFADDVTSPLRVPVLLDLFARVGENEHPSLALSGRQGSGKSSAMKTLAGATVDRGGRMFSIDTSTEREWFTFAESLRHSPGVGAPALVDVADPTASIDVLRTMPPAQAGPMLMSFLICLLNVSATSPQGRLLAKVLKPASLKANSIGSTGDLHDYLAKRCPLPGASDIADRMDVFADRDGGDGLAAALFDTSLPQVDLSSRMIVVGTSNVRLPSEEQLVHAHLFEGLGVETILGRAVYALLAQIARALCFSNRSEAALWAADEAHTFTRSSGEALRVLIDFLRNGRRAKAGLIVGSHDPMGDFADETLRGLISNRLAMRQTDLDVAKNSARFLGLDRDTAPDEFDETVQTLLEVPENSGGGIFRDGLRQIGNVQTVLPARPHRREAVLTTPPDQVQEVA